MIEDCKRKSQKRGKRTLLGVLILVIAAFFVTRPMRARIARETEKIERSTALKREALERIIELGRAAEAAQQKIARDPSDASAHLALASALGQMRRYPEAVREINTAKALDPANPEPHVALAEMSDVSGMQDVAIAEYRRALALNPNHPRALASLAYKYIALGWNQDAIRMLQRAITALPQDSRLHISLGLVHFQNGDYAAAEGELLTARKLAPEDQTILGPLAQVYRGAQKLDNALATYDEAIRAMPNRELLKIERARVLIEMKRYDEAISSANAILEESPERLEALYTRALAEKVKGDDPSAIRDFERIKAKQPWLEDTLLHLGQLYVRHSKVAEGSALLQQFKEKRSLSDNLARLTLQVAHKGDEPDSHLALGQAYLQGGSLARAIVEFRRTLELRPGDTVAKSLLAEALEKNGRTTEAKMIAVTEARGKGFGRE